MATDEHGGLALYRLWHPGVHTATATTARGYGPLFRFDPHPLGRARIHEGVEVWYGAEAFATAVRERFDRGAGRAGVCVRNRMSVVRLPDHSPLVDLTLHASDMGADSDIGERVEVDYADTQAWARAIVADLDPAGVRYRSARDRDAGGVSVGVNVALFSTSELLTVAEVPLAHPGAWRRALAVLDQAAVTVERLAYCPRCA